jgi:hypothetical protein
VFALFHNLVLLMGCIDVMQPVDIHFTISMQVDDYRLDFIIAVYSVNAMQAL